MRPQDASLDMIDVDLTPPEPFRFADDDEQPDEKKVNGDGDDTPTEEDPEQRISRRDRRINQLIARAKEAEERAAALEASLDLERQRLQNQEADSVISDDERVLDEQIAAIESQISSEADDPAMQSMLKANKVLLQREKSRLKVKQPEPVRHEQPQAAPQVHPAAQEWLSSNDWYTAKDEYDRPAYPTLAHEATSLYHRLRETYGGDSKELFDELNSRLSDYPEFERVLKKADKPKVNGDEPKAKAPERPSRQNTAPANAHADDRGAPTAGGAREPTLDKHDKATLRALGKDPDDPKVRAAYIKYNPRKFKGAS